MFVGYEHLFFVCFVRQQSLQFGCYFVHRKLIGHALLDDLFAFDDIDEGEVFDGEDKRLCPAYHAQ